MTNIQMPHKRIMPTLFLGVLMGALDVAIVGPALPSIGRAFDAGAGTLAWVFTIYVFFNLVGAPLLARLSDLHGRRVLYVAGVSIFALGSLVVAMAGSMPMLLAGRAVQGFGAGGIFPVASAVVGDTFPPERRGRALGLLGMVFGLAFLIGPLLGGILLRFGWRLLFLINLPIAAVVVFQAWRLLPAERKSDKLTLDTGGLAMLTISLILLATGVSMIDTQNLILSLFSMKVLVNLVLAMLMLVGFWEYEQKAAQPLIDPSVLAYRQIRIANFLALVAGLMEAGLVFVPSLIVTAFGVEPATASFLLLPAVLAVAMGAPATGQLLDRLGSKVVVLGGSVVLGGGLIAMRWLTGEITLFMAGEFVLGLGLASLVGAPLQYIVLNAADQEYRAASQAMVTLIRGVGRLFGGALVGAVIASYNAAIPGFHVAFAVLAAFVFLGTVSALGLKGREAERAAAR